MRLAGKRAVVTGGRQGIGRGIAEAFIAEGANVVTCGRGKAEVPGAEWVQADVADPVVQRQRDREWRIVEPHPHEQDRHRNRQRDSGIHAHEENAELECVLASESKTRERVAGQPTDR